MARQPGRESTITVAAIQTRAITGDKQGNNERALEAIHRACDEGARLLVLPELGNSGYVFNTRDEVAELAEPVFGWLCGSLAEADGGRYYNAAALVGSDGFVGRYRKVHLWDEEKLFFEPRDLGLNVCVRPPGLGAREQPLHRLRRPVRRRARLHIPRPQLLSPAPPASSLAPAASSSRRSCSRRSTPCRPATTIGRRSRPLCRPADGPVRPAARLPAAAERGRPPYGPGSVTAALTVEWALA